MLTRLDAEVAAVQDTMENAGKTRQEVRTRDGTPPFLGLSSFRNAQRCFREGSMQVRQCTVHDVGSGLSETRKRFVG
jgi:hypothetical protein